MTKKISIITINFNNLEGLKRTVQSVVNQTWQEFEYIVIDGGSTDGSAEYIQSQSDKIDYWVSEPDKGIYNAMNKGIVKATGEYLLFLNSGDSLANSDVLKKFIGYRTSEDIVYGDSLFIFPDKEPVYKCMPDSLEGMTIFTRTLNHQSVFLKRSLFTNERLYDINYAMLADWAFYNEVVLFDKGSYRHIDLLISHYDATGFSSNPENKCIMDNDRRKFYSKHIDFFIPFLLDNYYEVLNENKILKNQLKNSLLLKSKLKLKKFLMKLKLKV